MLKPILTSFVVATSLSGLAYADEGIVDPALQHGHSVDVTGTTHTHEINGQRVRHTHATQTANSIERLDQRIVALEAKYRSRRQVGAGFGPYSVAEWQARARAGQPGMVNQQEPWPTTPYRGR